METLDSRYYLIELFVSGGSIQSTCVMLQILGLGKPTNTNQDA